MSYNDKIRESKEKAYNRIIATKIIDLMGEILRKDNAKRRWIWELLQNAKDVGYPDIPVSVEIVFRQNEDSGVLEFKHNGKPFSIENITFLIEQVSTKDRSGKEGKLPETTGKFGTGFLTTHLLSKRVEVKGILDEPDLGPRQLSLLLDRSGKEIEEIIESVETSMSSLNDLDSKPPAKYKKEDFNTSFSYELDKEGISVAKIGLEDLHNSLPLTLAFLPSIKSVMIQSVDGITIYERSANEKINDIIQLITIEKTAEDTSQKIEIALLTEQFTTIAIEIKRENQKTCLQKINSSTPRIFCDFPLIGTEDFYFPVIVNNPKFALTEPRDGIYLTDNKDDEPNKTILKEAVELYFTLLDYASQNDWQDLYILANISVPKEKEDWLSTDWFKKSILKPVREKLLVTSIMDTVHNGRIPISSDGVYVGFPYHKDTAIREKIWELCNVDKYFILPIKQHIHDWYEIIWDKKYYLTLESITVWIAEQKSISGLAEALNKTEVDVIKWLNQYYQLINLDESALNLINQDKYAVIPNQKGDFCLKSALFIDKGIEEELKNAIKLLGEDWRKLLIDKRISTGEKIQCSHQKSQKDIIDRINKLLEEKEKEEACDYLISCFSDDPKFPAKKRGNIYNFCKKLFPDDVPEKRNIQTWDESIWKQVDKYQIGWLVCEVAEQKNVKQLGGLLEFPDEQGTLKWLDSFVSFLEEEGYREKLNETETPILPTQHGDFKVLDDLSLDDEIDDTLKDIAADLGHDFRNELLDIAIGLKLPENRTKRPEDVAGKIEKLIGSKLAEMPRKDETKKICRKLVLWFNNNKEQAEKLFSDYFKNKHRLYDDEEVAQNIQNIQKVEELEAKVEELEVEKNDLRQKLQQLQEKLAESEAEKDQVPDNEQPQEITEELLISWGVSSPEQLRSIFEKDEYLSKRYSHSANSKGGGWSGFMHAKGIIKRAKDKVKNHLEKPGDYDCTGWCDNNTPETLVTGVKKCGHPIDLIIRPSDGRKIIFYHTEEKTTLERPDSELWVEDDKSEPEQITLGMILMKKGAERIDL